MLKFLESLYYIFCCNYGYVHLVLRRDKRHINLSRKNKNFALYSVFLENIPLVIWKQEVGLKYNVLLNYCIFLYMHYKTF